MLKRTIRIISLLGSLGGLYGCTLDAPLELGKVQCGDDKDKLAVIIDKEHNICKREDVNKKDACAKYADAFRYNYCPHVPKNNNDKDNDDYICNESEQYGKYCSYKCDFLTQFITGNECINNTEKSCGSSDNNCLNREGWLGAECIDTNFFEASCSATECQDNYKKHDINNGIYECEKVECKDGWHVYNHDCEIDSEENCGSHGKVCTPYEGWNGVECVNGECVPAACGETYELNDEETNCIRLNCDDSKWNDECESNGCYIAENRCYKNNLDNCGGLGVTCAIKGAKTSICDHGTCKVDQNDGCDEYYKLDESETKCIEDSERIPCLDGYHPYIVGECMTVLTSVSQEEQIQALCCEENTDTNCGEHGLACGENEACVADYRVEEIPQQKIDEETQEPVYDEETHKPVYEVDEDGNIKMTKVSVFDGFFCKCKDGFLRIEDQCLEVETCDKDGYINTVYKGQSIRAYCIDSVEKIIDMRNKINKFGKYPNDNASNAYYLMTDLNLGMMNGWVPIGYNENKFSGMFIGNGHTITGNLICDSSCALFGDVVDSDILNLNLNIYTRSNNSIGSYVLANEVTNSRINNVHVIGIYGKEYRGGLVNGLTNSTLSGCSFYGDIAIEENGLDVGGLAVSAYNSRIESCMVMANISSSGKVGGLIGYGETNTIIKSNFRGQLLNGNLEGGIIGETSQLTVEESGVDGSLKGSLKGSSVGGFIGNSIKGYVKIKSSYFNGDIDTSGVAGGIVGGLGSVKLTIEDSIAIGKIENTNQAYYLGSFSGYGTSETRMDIVASCSIMDLRNSYGGFYVGYGTSAIPYGGYVAGVMYNVQNRLFFSAIPGIYCNKLFGYYNDINANECVELMYFTSGVNSYPYSVNGTTKVKVFYQLPKDRWEERTCEITSGPANGVPTKFKLPIPRSLPALSFCE